MRTFTYTFTGITPVNVGTLVGGYNKVSGLIIQTGKVNVDDLYFGDLSQQLAYILPATNTDVLPIKDLDAFYIRGSVGDSLLLLLF